MTDSYRFPPGFTWGVATSAYQIEGAAAEDGRGPSVWDAFPTRTGDTGATACDHYHRVDEDIALITALGVSAYRFSVSWPRVLPDGTGAVNERGLAFYDRLVDRLLAAGITPHATLFHWDSPLALEQRYGSWRSRRMAQDFADYAAVVVRRLGDRVRDWMTINEIPCFTSMGYGVGKPGEHAPGTVVRSPREVWQTVHHAMLAHGLGCQAVRAASPGPCRISLVDNIAVAVPVTETPEDIAAARIAFGDAWCNGAVTWPALTGRHSDLYLAHRAAEGSMPEVQPGDLELMHQPLDGYGVNIYNGSYVRAAAGGDGFERVPAPEGHPRMDLPWLTVVPESLYWSVRMLRDAVGWQGPVTITENGCAARDTLVNGECLDTDRIHFLRAYLRQAHRLCAEGYPLRGYFHWSLMDNFEWSWGYAKRLGLYYTAYETQRRIPKLSARWFRECVRANRVV
ncbi:MAG: hypothetical protein RLZZ127_98 [Planctomycetota bacterium]|jgi:beta-glucosidase